jgi:phage baseplate assembly protein W
MQVSSPLAPPRGALTDVSVTYGISSLQPLSFDEDVVAGEIYNVLSTLVGDEPWDPTYGSNIPLYAFAPFTPALEQRAVTDVYLALKTNVPQVSLSMSDTALLVSPDNRVLGITVGVRFRSRFFTVNLDLSGVYSG